MQLRQLNTCHFSRTQKRGLIGGGGETTSRSRDCTSRVRRNLCADLIQHGHKVRVELARPKDNYKLSFVAMKPSLFSLLIGSAAAFAPAPSARTSVATNAAIDDLKSIAEKSNPVLKVGCILLRTISIIFVCVFRFRTPKF